MTDPLRQEVPVKYKTMVKRTIVDSLRNVFDSTYPDEQFQNLKITPEFPLTKVSYPAIHIQFNEEVISNAGVGHAEYFRDPNGDLRKWQHRKFNGSITYNVVTLSPLDRDILSDALIEIFSFGRLNTLQSNFYNTLYGNPDDPFSILSLLSQLTVNTDEIEAGGESATIAPWDPEDVLVYTSSYTTTVTGGFYNSVPVEGTGTVFVANIDMYPYIGSWDVEEGQF
jgi:hypothetical protein